MSKHNEPKELFRYLIFEKDGRKYETVVKSHEEEELAISRYKYQGYTWKCVYPLVTLGELYKVQQSEWELKQNLRIWQICSVLLLLIIVALIISIFFLVR